MKKNFILSLLSAVLLVAAFPNFNFCFFIWVGLIPFLVLLDGKKPRSAFLWGWLTGFLFFLGTHYWLIHVTLPGMILVNLYLGIYFGLFGLGYAYFVGNGLRPFSTVHKLLVLPSLWVSLELIRDRLLTGFGWACLGHSQFQILPLIQIADIAGVFGVSFVIVMVNVLIKEFYRDRRIQMIPLVAVLLVILIVLSYGFWRIHQYRNLSESNFKIAVIQPNVPLSRTWNPGEWDKIKDKLLEMSQKTFDENPDLVIWPESSFPGSIVQSPQRYEQVRKFIADHNVPLLFGSVTTRGPGRYYNSAIFLDNKGREAGQYDKIHLVPFGEFLPMRPFLNFVENFIRIDDFTRGRTLTVFPQRLATEGSALPRTLSAQSFSVLICFEDTVAPLVRQMVKNGPTFLINITNDAWFKDTSAPYLHLQGSVFQAVANRRAIVRAANTGVSGSISPCGVLHIFRNPAGKTVMVEGSMMSKMQTDTALSPYTQFGDIFALLCLGISIITYLFFRYIYVKV